MQRAPLTPAERAQNLSSPRYAGDPDLEAAYDNSPPLKSGAVGEAVAKVQQGLVDDGFAMPVSTRDGAPDGIFGSETYRTVRAFQRKHGLDEDGQVGRQTMGRLDELARGPGPGPKRKQPEIEASEEEIGKRVAEKMQEANTGHSPTSGIWYDHNYHAEHLRDPDLYPWDEDWRDGFADPGYFDRIGYMDWRLKPHKSASEGIKAWVRGLTIAECTSAIVAIEIDTLRAAVGDDRFDELYGSADAELPEARRLRVRQGTAGTPVGGMFTGTSETGTIGNRPVKLGDWVYFFNHPKYLLKHPGGAFQGENAVYVGDDDAGRQLFEGLGVAARTERLMLEEMAKAYNLPRDGDDYVDLLETYAADAPEVRHPNDKYRNRDVTYLRGLYHKYQDRIPDKYREESGEFPDTVDVARILGDPPYELHGTTRTGGYTPPADRLDVAKVTALREGS